MLLESTTKKSIVIIVNGISSGVLMTEELAEDFELIHIESDSKIEAFAAPRFNKLNFKAFYQWDEQYQESIIEELRQFNPIAVIPGSESGVALSEMLASYLGIEGNDPSTTTLRRNKYFMAEAARNAGLRVTAQMASHDPQELKTWFTQQSIRKVVVKPLESAGSDDVYICTNADEVVHAAHVIVGRKNNFVHIDNHQALIQCFIDGTEFVVNTVSLSCKNKVTDVWRVTKRLVQGRNLYDFDDLCNPSVSDTKKCIDYTLRLLPTIGIVKGAGHTELILSPEGPTLLEVGARASGAANPKAIRLVTNNDQVRLMRYAYTDPAAFDGSPDIYQLKQPLRCVHAIASRSKTFSHQEFREFLSMLPGFVDVVMKAADNSLLSPTIDVETCPAAFFLTGKSQADIELSYARYREWEAQNL